MEKLKLKKLPDLSENFVGTSFFLYVVKCVEVAIDGFCFYKEVNCPVLILNFVLSTAMLAWEFLLTSLKSQIKMVILTMSAFAIKLTNQMLNNMFNK